MALGTGRASEILRLSEVASLAIQRKAAGNARARFRLLFSAWLCPLRTLYHAFSKNPTSFANNLHFRLESLWDIIME